MSYWSRIVNVFRGEKLNREIDEEMELHIQEAMEQGRDPEEARRAFGSALRLREESRDVRMAAWLNSVRADVVFGWRQLRKNKAASAAAVISLALATGACIGAFRLIDAMLLRPLPVADSARLYSVSYPITDGIRKTETADAFDYPQFRSLRAALKDQAEVMAISYSSRNALTFGSDDQMEKVYRQMFSGVTFSSFGLRPALGRLLAVSDDVKPGGHPVAVLSYDYWTRRFGRDPGVVGRKFKMGTDLYEIVGVCEPAFTGTETGTMTDVFMPTMVNTRAIENPHWGWFRIWVHLRPGVSPEVVQEKLHAAMSAWRAEQAKTWGPEAPRRLIETYLRAEVALEPAAAGVSAMQKEYRRSLGILGLVVALVLLIACANVANLMTAQAATRAREMALRVSIGAGRWRLVQLVAVESVMVAGLASLLGVLFAWWSAPFVLERISPADNPARLALPMDWRVLVFAAGLALMVTLLFGLAPALRVSSVRPMSALRGGEDPHSRRRLMNGLVAAQVAFCFLVFFVSGLFVATFERLSHEPTGFRHERILTLGTVTRDSKMSVNWEVARQQLRTVPGVESASICSWPLMSGNGWSDNIWVNGRLEEDNQPYFLGVSPGFMETMGIPMLGGRDFREGDAHPGKAIVNEAFARRYFGGRDPVGKSFENMVDKRRVATEIVGYVRDARYRDMRESIRPTIYVPFGDNGKGADWATFVVRTASSQPLTLSSVLRQEVTRARSEYRVSDILTQTELVEQHTVRERLLAMLSLFFAVVALVLSGVGLYGVLIYSVVQRRREIGIRMALGARAANVAWRVTAEVFAMVAVGALTGLAAGAASQRFLENLLYQVKATDAGMLGLPTMTILAVGLLAAVPPVLHAVRIDPATMLRAE